MTMGHQVITMGGFQEIGVHVGVHVEVQGTEEVVGVLAGSLMGMNMSSGEVVEAAVVGHKTREAAVGTIG